MALGDISNLTGELIAKQLDADKPNWFLAWADQRTLQEFALGSIDKKRVRQRVLLDIVDVTLRAAYVATAEN